MGDFACVLYTCSGSESVEAAIKTCRKYQRLRNQPGRKKIGAFSLSYHGTSYGAMSVSGIDQPLTDDYAPLLPEICWCPVPSNYKNEQEWAESIDVFFVRYGEELAGFIVEPVFASGGVVPVPAAVLRYLQKRCRQYDALFVIDEVALDLAEQERCLRMSSRAFLQTLSACQRLLITDICLLGRWCMAGSVRRCFWKSRRE